MAMTFNPKQRAYWQRLWELEAETGTLHLALRRLAMEIMALTPSLTIEIPGASGSTHKLKTFKNDSDKKDYIAEHSRNGVWGTDEILYVLANALGFNIHINVYGQNENGRMAHQLAYETKSIDDTGLSINIDNTGNHWQLTGYSTPGDGNCLYHAVAQQVEIDRKAKKVPVANIPSSTQKPLIQHTTVKDEPAYKAAFRQLETLSTNELIAAYDYALTLTDGDTYLQRRPYYFKQEQGSDILEKALAKQDYDQDFDYLVRDELTHMLSVEAWRNPSGARALENHMKTNHHFAQQKSAEKMLPLETHSMVSCR